MKCVQHDERVRSPRRLTRPLNADEIRGSLTLSLMLFVKVQDGCRRISALQQQHQAAGTAITHLLGPYLLIPAVGYLG